MVQADYDNDGFVDVLVLRGGWLSQPFPNSLLRNLGDGRFRDVTVEAGLDAEGSTQTAAWGDYDGDGWLDLLIGNETHNEPDPAELYRNNGDGTFTDVAAEVGLDVGGFTKAVLWGAVDNDGRPDAFFSRLRQSNRLYLNHGPDESGGWRFEAVEAAVEDFEWSFPAWFFDYDNDGLLDLFVNGWRTTPGELWREYRGQPHEGEAARLYRNEGDGTFTDVSAEAGIGRILHTMGSNFGDIDNDGFLDFYVGTGEPDLRALMPGRMFRNVGGSRFAEVTAAGGFGYLFKGHGVSFGDVDGDGDQDIHLVFGGSHEGDTSPNVLLENPGNGNAWVTLRLAGTRSNRSAIGARLALRVRGPGGERQIHRVVGSGGSFGASSLQQEIGLGDATEILSLTVRWPGGETEEFTGVRPDGVYLLREGTGRARAVGERPP